MPMTEQFGQLHLLAQGDAEGWMDIVFLVVVAAFWLIGGIVKAVGAGRKDRKGQPSSEKPAQRESFFQRLAKKAEELQRAAELQSKQQRQGARRPQPQRQKQHPAKPSKPAPGQVTVRAGRGGQSVLVYERQASPPPVPRERQRPSRPPTPRADHRVRPTTKPAPAPPPQEIPTVAPVPKALSTARSVAPGHSIPVGRGPLFADYRDAEALRRAILHMEILGKPLALRDPSEQKSQF